MKKLMFLLSVPALAATLFAAAPAPVLTPRQVVELQYTGEREFAKGKTGKEQWTLYTAWRIAHQGEVFASALPQIEAVAALNPGIAAIIIRNYVGATTNPDADPALRIEPVAGYDPAALSKAYSPGAWIGWFATLQEVAALEGDIRYVGNVRAAAKRLGDTGLVTGYYQKITGKGSTDAAYTRWFSAYLLEKTPAQALSLAKTEARAVDARPEGAVRDKWLQKLMTTIAVLEKTQP
jgi:hypothetical protein